MYEVAGIAYARARASEDPSMQECKTLRYYGHFESDQQTYRGAGEVEEVRRTRDCLATFVQRVTNAGLPDAEDLERVDQDVRGHIDKTVTEAKTGPDPTPAEVEPHVQVTYYAAAMALTATSQPAL